jgi:hypothetical protein
MQDLRLAGISDAACICPAFVVKIQSGVSKKNPLGD